MANVTHEIDWDNHRVYFDITIDDEYSGEYYSIIIENAEAGSKPKTIDGNNQTSFHTYLQCSDTLFDGKGYLVHFNFYVEHGNGEKDVIAKNYCVAFKGLKTNPDNITSITQGESLPVQSTLSNRFTSDKYESIIFTFDYMGEESLSPPQSYVQTKIYDSEYQRINPIKSLFSNITGKVTLYCYAQAKNGMYYIVGSVTVTVKLSTWNWDSSNGTATAEETEKAYNAVIGKGDVSDFSYKVWNDLVDKATGVAEAMGATINIESCKMTSNNKTLTAAKFNPVYGLAAYINTKDVAMITSVSVNARDPVRGKYFTNMADWINYRIGVINN